MQITVLDDVLLQDLGDEIVLLDLKSGRYLGLDPVGSTMWQKLLQTQSVDLAVEALLGDFEVDEATLRADLETFLARLESENLVRIER